MRLLLLLSLSLLVASCGGTTQGTDGGDVDATVADGGPIPDAGPRDAGPSDGGPGDFDATACAPRAATAEAIDRTCESPPSTPDPSACPAGYECTPFAGVRLGYNCEIPCAHDCQCPQNSTCGMRCDKAGCIPVCRRS